MLFFMAYFVGLNVGTGPTADHPCSHRLMHSA